MKDKVSRDNRRALPKFLLLIGVAALAGCIVGFFSGAAAGSFSAAELTARLEAFLRTLVPWGLPVCAAVLLIPAAVLFSQARTQVRTWDGEDEGTAWAVENRLNMVLLLTTLTMVAALFFLSLGMLFAQENMLPTLLTVGFFLAAMAAIVVLQQLVVDLTRRMNPEKEGSVYDRRFQKKWLESCDEAERARIGQAAYHAFRTASGVCMGVWLAVLLLSLFLEMGVFPAAAVLVVYGVLQCSYMFECIRMDRSRRP